MVRPSLLTLVGLSLALPGCKNSGDDYHGTCVGSLGEASWEPLDGIDVDAPFVGMGVVVALTNDPSGCSARGSGVLTLPDGTSTAAANLEFPGSWDLGVLSTPGEHALHAEVTQASTNFDPENGNVDLSVRVEPRPDCTALDIPALEGRQTLASGEALDLSTATLACMAGDASGEADPITDPVDAPPPTFIGHTTTFVLTASGGGALEGPDGDTCAFPLADGAACTLNVTGPGTVTLAAMGELWTAGDAPALYHDGYAASTALDVGYAPSIDCRVTDDTPDVATGDLELVVSARTADAADLRVEWVTRSRDATGEEAAIDADGIDLESNETLHLPLAEELRAAQAHGQVSYLVVATTADGFTAVCEDTLEVGPLDPSGSALVPVDDASSIVPVGGLATTGMFELRIVVRPDERYDGSYAELLSADEELIVRREGDAVLVEYGAFGRDSRGYGYGSYDAGTLVAPLTRHEGALLTQEIRVGVGPAFISLQVDGIEWDMVKRALDFSGLADGDLRFAQATQAHFESIGLFPTYPSGGLPWSTPCAAGHLVEYAWCVDFDEQAGGGLWDGDVGQEPSGNYIVSGAFDVIAD